MKLKSQAVILFAACIVLAAGVSVAYYNTSSFGYDNANLFSYTDESISVFDITVTRSDIEKIKNKLQKILPPSYCIACSCPKTLQKVNPKNLQIGENADFFIYFAQKFLLFLCKSTKLPNVS